MSIHSRRIDKYELQEQLGHGGMAEVWKAFDVQLQRHVAIKILHADLQEDPNFVARFEREAQLIASLHHPNIVQLHDFQIAGPEANTTTAYMVMDFVEGETLGQYIEKTSMQGNIPYPTEIVQLFTYIGLAVDYAHQNGVIHRDLKPANVMVTPEGLAKVLDFGLAKLDVLGLRDSTYVFFLSDHGFYFGEHGYFGKAEWFHDTGATITEGTVAPAWLPHSWLLTVGWSPRRSPAAGA